MWYYDDANGYYINADTGDISFTAPAGFGMEEFASAPVPSSIDASGVPVYSTAPAPGTAASGNVFASIVSAIQGAFAPRAMATTAPAINTAAFNLKPLIIPIAVIAALVLLTGSTKKGD